MLLTFLPLRRFRDFPVFARHDARITRQLRTMRGLAGYSKLGRPWVKRFWTLSAWEDEAALATFIHAGAHTQAMAELSRAWSHPLRALDAPGSGAAPDLGRRPRPLGGRRLD